MKIKSQKVKETKKEIRINLVIEKEVEVKDRIHLSDAEKELILSLHDQGLKNKAIAQRVKVPYYTIVNTIRNRVS